jgi:hypothetical protein
MNAEQDRANRIGLFNMLMRDILWMVTIGMATHVAIITLISLGLANASLPLTVLTIFVTLLTIAGGLDKMDNMIANVADTPNSEKDLHVTKYGNMVQWGMFKSLIAGGLGLTAVAELYMMWFA